MKTHQWLLHALLRAGGLVRGGSGRHSAGMAHVRTTRGLIISALVVGSLVLAAAELTTHGAIGHHLSALRNIANPFMY
jgi:hypothetical protein